MLGDQENIWENIWVFCGSSAANIKGWQSVLSDQENPVSNISRDDIYGAASTVRHLQNHFAKSPTFFCPFTNTNTNTMIFMERRPPSTICGIISQSRRQFSFLRRKTSHRFDRELDWNYFVVFLQQNPSLVFNCFYLTFAMFLFFVDKLHISWENNHLPPAFKLQYFFLKPIINGSVLNKHKNRYRRIFVMLYFVKSEENFLQLRFQWFSL